MLVLVRCSGESLHFNSLHRQSSLRCKDSHDITFKYSQRTPTVSINWNSGETRLLFVSWITSMEGGSTALIGRSSQRHNIRDHTLCQSDSYSRVIRIRRSSEQHLRHWSGKSWKSRTRKGVATPSWPPHCSCRSAAPYPSLHYLHCLPALHK